VTIVITWNMQGANWGTATKWHTGVANLFKQTDTEIALLQECGPPPASATLVGRNRNPLLRRYTWGVTRVPRSGVSILFYGWDTRRGGRAGRGVGVRARFGGNRVNLAIVTRRRLQIDRIHLVRPTSAIRLRPAIGVSIGNYTYYCIHAMSPGGHDARGLLLNVQRDAARVGRHAFVGGDFNRQPNTLPQVGRMRVIHPNNHTYPTWGPVRTYDYMYTSVRSAAAHAQGTVLTVHLSDHHPVRYNI
jgi:hypothetical protein